MKSYKDLYIYYLNKFNQKGLGKRPLLDIFEYVLNLDSNKIQLSKFPSKTNIFKYYKISNISKRVLNGYPLQYILKYSYFYGLKLYVNKNVLIPRDETEELVKWVIDENKGENLKILDLCSGSGCIGLALKYFNKSWDVELIDISKKANKVAKTAGTDTASSMKMMSATGVRLW